MLQKMLTEFAITRPKLVMFLSFFITLIFLVAFPNLKTDTDPVHMLPHDNEAVTLYNSVKSEFSISDMVGVGIKSKDGSSLFTVDGLTKIFKITEEIKMIKDEQNPSSPDILVLDDIVSVSTVDDIVKTEKGELLVKPLMSEPPTTQEQAQEILQILNANPMLGGKMSSLKGDLVGIFLPIINGKKERSFYLGEKVKSIVAKHLGPNETFYFAGLPIAESTFGQEMFIQMAVYAPMAGVVIFLLMLYFFRSAKIVAAPMILGMITVIWSMGALIYSGNVIHIMSSMIPIFLLPIAVLNSIHILSKLSERMSKHDNKEDAIRHVMKELFFPMLYTSLTTIIGFASLATTGIPPVIVFGITIAFGVFLSWLLSMVFIPAYTMLMNDKTLKAFAAKGEKKSPIVEFIQVFKTFSYKFPIPIIIGVVAILGISYIGLTKIIINDNPVRWFKEGHFLRNADAAMNEKLAGTYMANLKFSIPEQVIKKDSTTTTSEEGDEFSAFEEGEETTLPSVREPQVIEYIHQVETHLKTLKYNGSDLVGGTTSVVDVLRKIGSVAFNDESLPTSREQVGQYMFLFESGDTKNGKDLWKMINRDSNAQNTQMWVYFKSGDNMMMTAVMDELKKYTDQNPPPVFKDASGQEHPLQIKWSGLMHINNVWQSTMVTGMRESLTGSFVIVFIMMIFLFRSLSWGFIAMLPLTLTIVFIYGLIGFSGKFYDMPIAVLSSLTLGLSIDFAIHFIEHARLYNRRNQNFEKTYEEMFQGTNQAIWRNVLVISIGFAPLFFAGLVPYMTVGTFFFLIMLVSGIATLILMPAILKQFHQYLPDFNQKGLEKLNLKKESV